MEVVRTKSDLRAALAEERLAGRSVGFVPTMGAFHEGHLSLMRRAAESCDVVVVSLFVNPTQFNEQVDLTLYPSDETGDLKLADDAGVDYLFAPSQSEVYPQGFSTTVSVGGVSEHLCGAHRGSKHFQGVATVVTKLFNTVQPDVAFFGQKDAQQALVIKRLIRDLDIPVELKICPTVREGDGLALSSRNRRLDQQQREQAGALFAAITAATSAVEDGERSVTEIRSSAERAMTGRGVTPEYIEVVSTDTLRPLERLEGEALLALAAEIGKVRLIDNALLSSKNQKTQKEMLYATLDA